MPEHIIISGKSGVGNSTTAANLAAALTESGRRVAMIGYDPQRRSTITLRGRSELLPAASPGAPLFTIGFKDTLCIEVGELTYAKNADWYRVHVSPLLAGHRPNYIVHDLWQQPDKPFLLPPAVQEAPRLFAVSSGELSSVQTLNDLFTWLNDVSSSDCRFAGVIVNNTKNKVYEMIVNDFVSRTGTSVIASFEHSPMVSMSNYLKETLIEAAPCSHNTILYRRLAQQIIDNDLAARPTYFDETELEHWSRKWYDIIARMESGVVMDGSGI